MRLSRYGGGEPPRPDAARPLGARRRLLSGNRRAAACPTLVIHSVAFWKPILPRKEVIQPHVPVRLPCYDFTPLTLHTFDASAPRGFGRRLRVQTTRVV